MTRELPIEFQAASLKGAFFVSQVVRFVVLSGTVLIVATLVDTLVHTIEGESLSWHQEFADVLLAPWFQLLNVGLLLVLYRRVVYRFRDQDPGS